MLEACRDLARPLHAALAGPPERDRGRRRSPHRQDLAPPGARPGGRPLDGDGGARHALGLFAPPRISATQCSARPTSAAPPTWWPARRGQLAGAHYARSAIPATWRNSLMKRDFSRASPTGCSPTPCSSSAAEACAAAVAAAKAPRRQRAVPVKLARRSVPPCKVPRTRMSATRAIGLPVPRPGVRARAPRSWARLSDQELLQMRFCDLKLAIERSPLKHYVRRLYAELSERGITSVRTCGCPRNGFPRMAYRVSPCRSISRIRASSASSAASCARPRAAIHAGSCESCVTRPATRSITPIGCAAETLARSVRPSVPAVPGALQGAPRQPPLRASPGRVVRAGASNRGFRGDLRGVAEAEIRLAQELRRMAGASTS